MNEEDWYFVATVIEVVVLFGIVLYEIFFKIQFAPGQHITNRPSYIWEVSRSASLFYQKGEKYGNKIYNTIKSGNKKEQPADHNGRWQATNNTIEEV